MGRRIYWLVIYYWIYWCSCRVNNGSSLAWDCCQRVDYLTIWLIRLFSSFWSFTWLVYYFHYFGLFRVSLIEIWLKFNTKLTLIKDRSFPHLRIHLLCKINCSDWLLHDPDLILTWTDVLSNSFDWMDLLLDCYIILVRFFSTYTHSFVSIHTQCFLDSSWMPSPYNSLEACRGAHLLPMLDFIIYYMDHL